MPSKLIGYREVTRGSGSGAPRCRPLIMELVGPAGVGKTTLLHALQQRDSTVRAGLRLSPRQHLASALPLLSTFRALHRPYRGLLWKEMKRIIFLHTLERVLQAALAEQGVMALDEGAVYMLARLRVLSGEGVQSRSFECWRQAAIERWSHLLDIVVWLDADDSVLAHRLRTRSQAHPARGFSDEATKRFMAMYRGAYEDVVTALAAAGSTEVMRFRTDRETSTSIAEHVVSEISRRCP